MKKIDAHSHIGSFGGWAGVAFTAEKLLEQMDEYEIEKTFLTGASFRDNDTVAKAFHKYPDKIVPFVWVNPLLDNVPEKLHTMCATRALWALKCSPCLTALWPTTRWCIR